jgi:hypothetical protein
MRNIEIANSELSLEIWLEGPRNQPVNPLMDGLNRVHAFKNIFLTSVSVMSSQITHLLADICHRYCPASNPGTADADSGTAS